VAIDRCDFGISPEGDDVIVFLPEPLPAANCTFVISRDQVLIRDEKGAVISQFSYQDTRDGRIFNCFKQASSQVAAIEFGKDGLYPGAATALMWVDIRNEMPESVRSVGREFAL